MSPLLWGASISYELQRLRILMGSTGPKLLFTVSSVLISSARGNTF